MSVLEKQLSLKDFLAGVYSIADMACYPWIHAASDKVFDWDVFPAVKRWYDKISGWPAVAKGMKLLAEVMTR